MTAEEALQFTVRPLPRGKTLEGAFRVHFTSKDLEALEIKPGDLCQLLNSDGTSGTGIAWRSTEPSTNANIHPVKVTDTFRDAFAMKLGNLVTVTRSSSKIYHADKVIITDVSDHDTPQDQGDDDSWTYNCCHILASLEAIANGIAFEAVSRKGLRKRFLIESINHSFRDSNVLFFFNDSSQLILQDKTSGPIRDPRMASMRISSDGIAGLDKQIDVLNKRLDRFIGEREGRRIPSNFLSNDGILLFGLPGTGKSLILDRLALRPWRKCLRIDRANCLSTRAPAQFIRNAVTEALFQQPSLIIIENIQDLTSKDDPQFAHFTDIFVNELARARNSRVLIIATATSPSDLPPALSASEIFNLQLEFPVPLQDARLEILKNIHKTQNDGNTSLWPVLEYVADKTHGFVGKDLLVLYKTALDFAQERYLENESFLRSDSRDDESIAATLVNGGHVRSRPSMATIGSISTAGSVLEERAIYVSILQEDFDRALTIKRPSTMRDVFLETPKVKWSEIGGSKHIEQQLTQAVIWPLKHQKRMKQYGTQPKSGLLLYGPPGCSKTMTAKAVATGSGLNFLAVKGAELTSMYVGESERAVREVFRKARTAAPSILFFDEIDSIASARNSNGNSGLNVLTTLLNEMDGIEAMNGVFVLAATNRPEILDPALLRPGRFDGLVYIPPPSAQARQEILAMRTAQMPLSENVKLESLVKDTEGYSGAEIVGLCALAAEKALARQIAKDEQGLFSSEIDSVGPKDFQEAMAKTVRRITPAMVQGYERWEAGVQK